jgi:trk system potassium uptake protein TrkH
MNHRFIVNQLCALFMVLSAALLVVAGLFFFLASIGEEAVDGEARTALVSTGGGGLVIAFFLWFLTRGGSKRMGRRDAMLLVTLSWLLGAVFSALPFFIWAHLADVAAEHPFRNFIDCYFEAMSGLTTTGSSVLTSTAPTDVESLPRSLLLWRAFTQCIGGIGIVVIFVALLPGVGVGTRHMFFNEATGPVDEGVTATIRSTARVLVLIYLAFSLALGALLLVCGMTVFDAVCHTFATISTGGFSTRNASIGAYDSPAIDVIVSIFMILGAISFALYYQLIRGRAAAVWRNPELRLFVVILAGVALIGAWSIADTPVITSAGEARTPGFLDALRYSLFNVASVMTTTGFATADFGLWPGHVLALVAGVMFVGGCAGSTAGGLKVARLFIAFKSILAMVERAFRPQVVRPLRLGEGTVSEDVQLATLGFIACAAALLAGGSLALVLFEPPGSIDAVTAMTANLTAFCNVGPGLGAVGPAANFEWMTSGSKIVLSLQMMLGRLEIVTVLALLAPGFWGTK